MNIGDIVLYTEDAPMSPPPVYPAIVCQVNEDGSPNIFIFCISRMENSVPAGEGQPGTDECRAKWSPRPSP